MRHTGGAAKVRGAYNGTSIAEGPTSSQKPRHPGKDIKGDSPKPIRERMPTEVRHALARGKGRNQTTSGSGAGRNRITNPLLQGGRGTGIEAVHRGARSMLSPRRWRGG